MQKGGRGEGKRRRGNAGLRRKVGMRERSIGVDALGGIHLQR